MHCWVTQGCLTLRGRRLPGSPGRRAMPTLRGSLSLRWELLSLPCAALSPSMKGKNIFFVCGNAVQKINDDIVLKFTPMDLH